MNLVYHGAALDGKVRGRHGRCSSSKESFTTIPLHRRILADPDFRAAEFDTTFTEWFLTKGGKH